MAFGCSPGCDRSRPPQELQAQASDRLTPVRIDVTDAASIAAAAETVARSVGDAGLAGLVNNAGIAVSGPLEIVPIEALRRQLEVNVIGQVAVTQSLLPLLRKARGRVVNMSSISGGVGAFLGPVFGVEVRAGGDHRHASRGTALVRIHVSAVEPGPVSTPIWEKSIASADRLSHEASAETLSLYEADSRRCAGQWSNPCATAAPVDVVVRAVVHALTAKRPKTRYFLAWSVRYPSSASR